jgi:fermentation-respiration switch protein FrsA (DUF1100 family)
MRASLAPAPPARGAPEASRRAYFLKGVAKHITCPLLIVQGGRNQQIPAEHCSSDNLPLARGTMADWSADVLRAEPTVTEGHPTRRWLR